MILSLWIAVLIIQMGMVGLFAYQFTRYQPFRTLEQEIPISVIIAAHNEEANLKKLIPRLLEQEYSNFEVILGLDRTTDESIDYLKELNHPRLKWVEVRETPANFNEKKYVLSQAIQSSQMEWLVFTDADCFPNTANWLREMASKMKGKDIVLGYSPYLSNNSFLQSFIQYESFITGFHYLSVALLGKPYMGVGRNMAVRKSFFLAKNGYDLIKGIKGGDDDLFIQQHATATNTTIVLSEQALVYTYPKTTWKDYLRQKLRHLSVGKYYSGSDQLVHFTFNISLIMVWLLLPFLQLEIVLPIILFYLSIKLLGYRFAHIRMGSGFNYILLPLVESIYSILIPVVAIRSKLVKDIKWKN
ncbi:MAG: glycosyltransferase [Bacteroidota bacterium]